MNSTLTVHQSKIIEAAMDAEGIPGVAVAIVSGGKIVAAQGYGYRNLNEQLPMTPETVTPICSLTKSMTGTAIMQLVEQGKVSLDEPAQTYLPDLMISDPDTTRKITPRVLLSHKSGMGRTGHQPPMWREKVSPYRDRADLVSRLADVQMQTPPNTAWSYCNEGFATVGHMIETIFGLARLGYTDAKASDEMGRKLEQLAAIRAAGETPEPELSRFVRGLPAKLQEKLARWGLLDGAAYAGTKPLTQHLDDYKKALLAGVASRRQNGPATDKHAELVHNRVETLLNGIDATVLADVRVEQVGDYLAKRRTKGLSAQSSNHYLRSCKAFLSWMVRTGRATTNSLANVAPMQVTPKLRKHVRRPLEHDEAATLLQTTRTGSTCEGMPAEERYWL
ncbi:MAG: serine hydrolase, partial [Chloroflexi bacterium]|nr:serine hydrolase [Chloroflexota bacterium]